jgi:Zn-dependent peptidase ImmA (M78 family)
MSDWHDADLPSDQSRLDISHELFHFIFRPIGLIGKILTLQAISSMVTNVPLFNSSLQDQGALYPQHLP